MAWCNSGYRRVPWNPLGMIGQLENMNTITNVGYAAHFCCNHQLAVGFVVTLFGTLFQLEHTHI